MQHDQAKASPPSTIPQSNFESQLDSGNQYNKQMKLPPTSQEKNSANKESGSDDDISGLEFQVGVQELSKHINQQYERDNWFSNKFKNEANEKDF